MYQDRPDILFLCFVFQLILLLLLLSGCQTRPAPTTQKGGGELCCCSIATEMLSDFTDPTLPFPSPRYSLFCSPYMKWWKSNRETRRNNKNKNNWCRVVIFCLFRSLSSCRRNHFENNKLIDLHPHFWGWKLKNLLSKSKRRGLNKHFDLHIINVWWVFPGVEIW